MIELPKPNPPTANSPLPAWQHYEITRFADLAIQEKLRTEPTQMEFLIGLEVQYFVSQEEDGEETNYAMPFGKVKSTLKETHTGKSALRREFLEKIYEEVDTYVRKNVQQPYLVTNVIMQVRTNIALYNISCVCWTIGTKYRGYDVRCDDGNHLSGTNCTCCWNGSAYVCSNQTC